MDRKKCSTCDAELNDRDLLGLCPACLLKKGLGGSTPDPLSCSACQSPLNDGAKFCDQCGVAVSVEPVAGAGDPLRTALEAKLRGQYRFIRLLGQGGMGEVYLARDLTLDREVAIKIVRTASEVREIYDRFRREAKTAARLSHPNIVPLHAFGNVEGMPYFVMGYVRGESLAARLRRDGKLSEEESRRILAEIADALDHAHRQGVVHRDIKPDNVLLDDESGRALLTDFGVAKALGQNESLTRAGSVLGTPHYMSPEQAAGRSDLDSRSDIYSLGIMGYAMLAGRLPFEGSSVADILSKHLTQHPPALRSLAPALADSTVHAVERCLSKDPAQRWPDARSLKVALGAVEETHLPDALQDVQGKGIAGLAYVMIVLVVLFIAQVQEPSYVYGGFVYSYIQGAWAGMAVILYLYLLARLRSGGFSVRQSQRAIWTEPEWWPFWYPRALRRRGNVWQRLPASVRRARAWSNAIWLYIAVCVPVGVWFDSYSAIESHRWYVPELGALGVITAIWFFLVAQGRRELKSKGLTSVDINRVLISIPASRISFWTRPHIAPVLAPVIPAEQSLRPDTPHDQLLSILRHANEMSGLLRPLGAEASVAARQLLASIDHADQEIAELARNLEPGEEERLADKIAAMAPKPGQGDEYAPMRLLLEKQLELIGELSARIEQAREVRSRRIEMLKTLALHVASLRARSVEAPAEVSPLSDRVRAICDEIQALSEAKTTDGSVHERETVPRTPA